MRKSVIALLFVLQIEKNVGKNVDDNDMINVSRNELAQESLAAAMSLSGIITFWSDCYKKLQTLNFSL